MSDNESLHEALRAAEPTPISQLNPDLPDQATRAVDGAVTITWPFSIVTKSIAFIVAERDFRLRREKGQIRIRFYGAAAKAITDASVGGGDEVRLGLAGAKWEKNESNTQLAGSTLEWQLEYTNRLMLIIRGIDSQERVINIDVSDADMEIANGQAMTSLGESPTMSTLEIPPPDLSDISSSAKRPAPASFESQEFASPAFLKRARVSYGSLYEGGFDIFDEDVGRKNKTKKKSRFSMPATTWRYSSRSPSPEAESDPEPEPVESTGVNGIGSGADKEGHADKAHQATEDVPMNTPPRPAMVDEGCQTMDVDFTPMNSVQVSAEARSAFAFPYATPTPLPRTRPIDPEGVVLDHPLQLQVGPVGGEPSASEMPAEFLGQSAHGDNGLTFGFATAQPIMYPAVPNIFSAPQSEESLHGSIPDIQVSENYPASFLENSTLSTAVVDTHPSLSSHDSPTPTEPHPSEQVGTPFQNDAHFYSPYHAASQPPPSTWAAVPSAALSSVDADNIMENDIENDMENDMENDTENDMDNDVDNPVEILSSSPTRDRDASEDIPSSPSERTGLTSIPPHFRRQPYAGHAMPETLPEEDENAIGQEDSADEASDEEEEQYQDGGDKPGDDYDLRNYDRAHDDDDDTDRSEDDQGLELDGPEAQIINPEEEEDDDDAEVLEEQEYDTGAAESDDDQFGEDPDPRIERDVEGEYYSGEESCEGEGHGEDEEAEEDEEEEDEEEEDEEEEDEEEEEEETSHLQTPAAPEVIDLISDSEDEDEAEPEQADEPEQPQETDQKSEANEAPKPPTELEEPAASKDIVTASPLEDSTKPSQPEPSDAVPETVQDPTPKPTTSEDANVAPSDEMEVDNEPLEPSTTGPINEEAGLAELDNQEPEKDNIIQTFSNQTPQPESAEKSQTLEQVEERESPAICAKSPDVDMADSTAPARLENETKEGDIAQQAEDAHTDIATPTKSPDAMDVDGTGDVDKVGVDDLTATADNGVANDDAKEVKNAITEEPSAATEDQGGLNETSAHSSPENDVQPQPLPMSGAPAQEIEPSQEEPESTHEEQGQGRAESPDATMQDASQVEMATETRPWQAINMPEMDTGEVGVETSKPQQLVPDGQMSPPATQPSHSQPLQEAGEPTLSQATSTFSNLEHDHLPTPGETQTEEAEMTENYHLTEHGDGQIDEDDLSPEDQIMAEIQQHSPTKPNTALPHAHPVTSSPTASPKPRHALTEANSELESTDMMQASDALITVKSLRSRGHRSTKSKSSDISLVDPNLSLAKSPTSPTQADDDVKVKGPLKTLRITRSKSDQVDPSIKLARASTHAAASKGKGRERDATDETDNSPPAKLRVSRSRTDHVDPSIQLAKGPASSTRQSRRLVTPEAKHELGSSSRGPAQKASTPDTAVSAPLQSPSVAGSSAAPEDENVGTVKLQLLKSLRTSLPDSTSLKMLRNSLHQSTDIIAVATATPAQPHRPKHGPRDYMLTLSLTDPSVAPTGVSVAHIFRPHQASLPVVQAGDVVLLRRVQVVSMKGRGFGVRAGDASAWAVFEKGAEQLLPQIKGSQLEVAENELRYVEGLRRWWGLLDDKSMEKMERASRKVSEAGKEDVK